MLKAFLCNNAFRISTTTLYNAPFLFSLKFFSTSNSHSHPFTVSYLIGKFGFSQEFALKASKELYFKTSQKPDSVLNFLKNHGFTDSHIRNIIKREPWILSCDTHKTILPKFQFLISKGASSSDIVRMVVGNPKFLKLSLKNHQIKFEYFLSKGASSSDIVSLLTANPAILQISLEKRIIPLFELFNRFFNSSKDTILCLIRYSGAFIINPYRLIVALFELFNRFFNSSKDTILCLIRYSGAFIINPYRLIVANINLMADFGVSDNVIASLLQSRPSIFGLKDLIKSLEEVKCLGFDPKLTTFGVALVAKKGLSKKLWDEKVDTFKKWGWSDEDVIRAFRYQPNLMLASIDKISLLMSFWVNQLGWDSLALAKFPNMFCYSLHKRIIPRASVLHFLLMKGLRKKNASYSITATRK